jgi:hypothetical protein
MPYDVCGLITRIPSTEFLDSMRDQVANGFTTLSFLYTISGAIYRKATINGQGVYDVPLRERRDVRRALGEVAMTQIAPALGPRRLSQNDARDGRSTTS